MQSKTARPCLPLDGNREQLDQKLRKSRVKGTHVPVFMGQPAAGKLSRKQEGHQVISICVDGE